MIDLSFKSYLDEFEVAQGLDLLQVLQRGAVCFFDDKGHVVYDMEMRDRYAGCLPISGMNGRQAGRQARIHLPTRTVELVEDRNAITRVLLDQQQRHVRPTVCCR